MVFFPKIVFKKGHDLKSEGNKIDEDPEFIQHILFLKKDKVTNGNAPLYVRIKVNGEPFDLSLKRKVPIVAWNQKEQQLYVNTDEDRAAREKIRKTRNNINAGYENMRYQKEMVSAEALKAKVEGADVEQYTLCKLMTYHKEEIGTELEQGTLRNYDTTELYLKEFLKAKKKGRIFFLPRWITNSSPILESFCAIVSPIKACVPVAIIRS